MDALPDPDYTDYIAALRRFNAPEVVGGVVADLLEAGQQLEHQAAAGLLVGLLDAAHRLAHQRLVEDDLLPGQADQVVGLGLGRQLRGDARVRLAPTQQEGADQVGELPEAAVWIDLVNPTTAEDKLVEKLVGVEIPTREEMQEIEISSRLYIENGARYMTATLMCQSDTDMPKTTAVNAEVETRNGGSSENQRREFIAVGTVVEQQADHVLVAVGGGAVQRRLALGADVAHEGAGLLAGRVGVAARLAAGAPVGAVVGGAIGAIAGGALAPQQQVAVRQYVVRQNVPSVGSCVYQRYAKAVSARPMAMTGFTPTRVTSA